MANYFDLTITQLVEEGIAVDEQILNTQPLGWKKIPFVDWGLIGKTPMDLLLRRSKQTVVTDIQNPHPIFATRMMDDSMEPKFSEKTLLIFKSQNTMQDKEFALIFSPEQELMLRQIFIKKTGIYQKSLNPKCKSYELTRINPVSICIGLLLQSRTDHVN